ncbi:lipoprotein NlpI [Shewanella sp. 202IG2-18]|uniref:lipoprotein NlpI n=1 Tax=Parashewanella hymeniacidonis TaxID=2807618 RepID=UPI0019602D75|nr:lipoprotein NlpI [Parashewanella hymeniacidonis]MBM7071666.1 lipoprotein NlpI [Parashewanella hymeniacidonis]
MKLNLRVLLTLVFAGWLTGCATTQKGLLFEPVLPNYQTELNIAKLNDILSTVKLTEQQRARFHYDRGVLYDKVGLRLLARYDFRQALKVNPRLADAYNFLGIYYTQEGDFDNAYEAFDSVLELAPNYDYAHLNLGIALYYGKRNKLASQNLEEFYKVDTHDGYRVLWLFIANRENDKKAALETLKTQREQLNPEAWSTVLVDYYLGKVSESALLKYAKENLNAEQPDVEYTERLCEAYFYMAKQARMKGNNKKAVEYLKLVLATNVHDFVEYRYAGIELSLAEKALLELK